MKEIRLKWIPSKYLDKFDFDNAEIEKNICIRFFILKKKQESVPGWGIHHGSPHTPSSPSSHLAVLCCQEPSPCTLCRQSGDVVSWLFSPPPCCRTWWKRNRCCRPCSFSSEPWRGRTCPWSTPWSSPQWSSASSQGGSYHRSWDHPRTQLVLPEQPSEINLSNNL